MRFVAKHGMVNIRTLLQYGTTEMVLGLFSVLNQLNVIQNREASLAQSSLTV